MQPQVIKNYNLFVDGVGYAGKVGEVTLPDLTLVIEDHRAGGMDAPTAIDMGMEALEMSFMLSEQAADVLRRFGLNNQNGVSVTLRASMTSNTGGEQSYKINGTGMISGLGQGSLNAGDKNELEVTMRLNYYKMSQGGRAIHEIDVLNFKRIIDGVDQLEQRRLNLGA